MSHVLSLEDKATSIVEDLLLLKQFQKSPASSAESITKVNSIEALGRLLRVKNATYKFSDEQRYQDQGWIIGRGANIRPLAQRVRDRKIQIDKQVEEIRKARSSHFYVSPDDLCDQNEYMLKNVSYFQFYTVKAYAEGVSNFRAVLIDKLLNRNKKKQRNKAYKPQKAIIDTSYIPQDEKKVDLYLKATSSIFQTKDSLSAKQWTAGFKSATQLQLWEIMDNLLILEQKIDESRIISQVALNALKMVQSEFNKTMPSNFESLVYYLTTNYLRKMPGKYKTQGNFGPIWGICYLLYKAGRKQQFYRFIEDQKLRESFQSADESIMRRNPHRITGHDQNEDAFHDQLLYALSGSPKFASEVLCGTGSLDISWVFLRNVGIFPEGEQKFKHLREELEAEYRGEHIDQIKTKNLLYLLCFECLVEMGPNLLIDSVDYLHLLIALYYSQVGRLLCPNKSLVEGRLAERTLQFVKKLILESKKQSLFYIALMPTNHLASEVSSLLVSLNQTQKIKWQHLRKYIPEKVFAQLVVLTCRKNAEANNDYILAAEKVEQLLGNSEAAAQFVVDMFVKWMLGGVFDQSALEKGERIFLNITKGNERVKLQYSILFQFFHEYRQLSKLLASGKPQKLYAHVKNCQHILISQQLRVDTAGLLQKLISKNGFDCYITYMKAVVRAYELCLSAMGRPHDLQQLQRTTLSALIGLINTPVYKHLANRESVLELVRSLEQSLYRYS